MTWNKKPPTPPEKGSEFYWYYDFKDQEMWNAEIYKGCWKIYTYDGLWWHEPTQPPKQPTLEERTNGKTRKRKAQKRN